MTLFQAFALTVLPALLLAASGPAAAASEVDRTMRRFMLGCDRAGKSDAIHACSIDKLVQAGDLPAAVVQACRDDLGTAAVADPNTQVWLCAKLRQFGPRMAVAEWRDVTAQDCFNRAGRTGHPYARRQNDCIADAIIASQRVAPDDVAACRARPGIEKNHRLLNCLDQALRRDATSPPAPARSSSTATPSTAPEPVRSPGHRREEAQAATREADIAQYPVERVRTNVRSGCEAHNRSSLVAHDCACMVQEADRQMEARRLPRRAISRLEFDSVACIDRPTTADKWAAHQFLGASGQALERSGVDVEALRACGRQQVAEGLPAETLQQWSFMNKEILRRCLKQR